MPGKPKSHSKETQIHHTKRRTNTKTSFAVYTKSDFRVKITHSLGNILPACCTSSYKSIIEQPRFVSSIKKISSFLNSSNARISKNIPNKNLTNYILFFNPKDKNRVTQ